MKILFPRIAQSFALDVQDEWEKELEQLSVKWERERGGKIRTQQFQQEKEDLEKNMTLKRDKKKESITRKMLEHERYLNWSLKIFRKISNPNEQKFSSQLLKLSFLLKKKINMKFVKFF